jgi:dienelactone hydrolase
MGRSLALPAWLALFNTLALGAPLLSRVEQVPVTVDGQRVRLQMRIYTPAAQGRFPTLIFNHGSTGYGTDAGRFKQAVDAPAVAAFFVERGWAVVMPARRGRAGSDGQYDEGFSTIRALGYSCIPSLSLAGADRALRDIEAATSLILQMPFVDAKRVVIAGSSRGGALSVAYAGVHPAQVRGVINFVGGWLGRPCPTMTSVNQSVFNRGASFAGQSLWLYAENDSYYSLSHSQENFAAFKIAGGKGLFHGLKVPAENGHWLPEFPNVWSTDVEAYLGEIGLPSRPQQANPSVEH